MQAADFRNLDHLTERRKLDGSAGGRIFFERQMRTASFVVFEIILQNPARSRIARSNGTSIPASLIGVCSNNNALSRCLVINDIFARPHLRECLHTHFCGVEALRSLYEM
jgi:hypothetical protein